MFKNSIIKKPKSINVKRANPSSSSGSSNASKNKSKKHGFTTNQT